MNISAQYYINLSESSQIEIAPDLEALDLDRDICSACWSFDSWEEAEEFVSNFPKYCKLSVQRCYHGCEGDWYPVVMWEAHFDRAINDVTGEVNEAGQKRINKILAVLKNLQAA